MLPQHQGSKTVSGHSKVSGYLGLSHIGQHHKRSEQQFRGQCISSHLCICGLHLANNQIPSNSCQIFQLFQFEQQLDKKQWIIVTNVFSVHIIILNILGMGMARGLSLSVQNMGLYSVWYLFPWTVLSQLWWSIVLPFFFLDTEIPYSSFFFLKYTLPPDLIQPND